jgi:hypothetical protein
MTRFSFAPEVDRRPIDTRSAVVFRLECPPSRKYPDAVKKWETRTAWAVAMNRPQRMPGPVRIQLEFPEERGRTLSDDIIDPILQMLDKYRIIDGNHRTIVRELTARFAHVGDVLVTIESAVSVERRSA